MFNYPFFYFRYKLPGFLSLCHCSIAKLISEPLIYTSCVLIERQTHKPNGPTFLVLFMIKVLPLHKTSPFCAVQLLTLPVSRRWASWAWHSLQVRYTPIRRDQLHLQDSLHSLPAQALCGNSQAGHTTEMAQMVPDYFQIRESNGSGPVSRICAEWVSRVCG